MVDYWVVNLACLWVVPWAAWSGYLSVDYLVAWMVVHQVVHLAASMAVPLVASLVGYLVDYLVSLWVDQSAGKLERTSVEKMAALKAVLMVGLKAEHLAER